ncbi:hypothetical protein L9F63_019356, partial [Diploptera punctata]
STIHDPVTKFETTGSVQNKKHTRRPTKCVYSSPVALRTPSNNHAINRSATARGLR